MNLLRAGGVCVCVCVKWMKVYIVSAGLGLTWPRQRTGTAKLSESAPVMPRRSPLKQGIMLQNKYTGG